jgi:hypothetical protein
MVPYQLSTGLAVTMGHFSTPGSLPIWPDAILSATGFHIYSFYNAEDSDACREACQKLLLVCGRQPCI